ncbi:MAG: hypothetical protein HDS15_05765 [Bacteroides sp.]|nr:hypothetical protein [Bacteroides sp.]MDE7471769.1 hypothetical protein [Paramuribaculum sp.]
MKLRILLTITFCLLVSAIASANDTLDKLFSKLETEKGAKVTVSEERDPSTGNMKTLYWYISFPSTQTSSEEIIKVFMSQRPKAMKFRITDNFYSIEFLEDGNNTLYTATIASGSKPSYVIKRMEKARNVPTHTQKVINTTTWKNLKDLEKHVDETNPDVIVINGVTFHRVKK